MCALIKSQHVPWMMWQSTLGCQLCRCRQNRIHWSSPQMVDIVECRSKLLRDPQRGSFSQIPNLIINWKIQYAYQTKESFFKCERNTKLGNHGWHKQEGEGLVPSCCLTQDDDWRKIALMVPGWTDWIICLIIRVDSKAFWYCLFYFSFKTLRLGQPYVWFTSLLSFKLQVYLLRFLSYSFLEHSNHSKTRRIVYSFLEIS